MSSPAPSPPSSGLPDWYEEAIERIRSHVTAHPGRDTAMLADSRKDFQQALALFNTQAQYVISIYFALFAVIGISISFVLKDKPDLGVLFLPAGILLLVGFRYGWVARRILLASYTLYVASIVYADQLHRAAGVASHAWFAHVEKHLETLRKRIATGAEPADKNNVLGLVDVWTHTNPGNLFQLYCSLVWWLKWLSFVAGLWLVGRGVQEVSKRVIEAFA